MYTYTYAPEDKGNGCGYGCQGKEPETVLGLVDAAVATGELNYEPIGEHTSVSSTRGAER